MQLRILPQVAAEMKNVPFDLKESIFELFSRLERGENIPMPTCRPLPGIGKGLYELRLSHSSGEWRIFYWIKLREAIYVLHAVKKKTQKIDQRITRLLRSRMRCLW